MPRESEVPPPRAVLFDMDGTLTRPLLDFDAIRQDVGVDGPILEAIARMPPEQAETAMRILRRHESLAAESATPGEGCIELLALLDRRSIPTALVTRNSLDSVRVVLRQLGISPGVVITREEQPCKPHPHPVVLACRKLGVLPQEAWLIGDGHHDIESGNAAGTATIWVSHGQPRGFAAVPWREVASLHEVIAMLEPPESVRRQA